MSGSSGDVARASLDTGSFRSLDSTRSGEQGSIRRAVGHRDSSGPSTFAIRDSTSLERHLNLEKNDNSTKLLPEKGTSPVYATGLPLVLQEQLDAYYESHSRASAPPPVTATGVLSSSQEADKVEWYHAATKEPLEAMVQKFETPGLAKSKRRLVWVRGATVGPYIVKFGGQSGVFLWGRGSIFNIWYGGGAKIPYGTIVDDDDFEIIGSVHKRTLGSAPTNTDNPFDHTNSARLSARASVPAAETESSPITLPASPKISLSMETIPSSSDEANILHPENPAKRFKASQQSFNPSLPDGQADAPSSSSIQGYLRDWAPVRATRNPMEESRLQASASLPHESNRSSDRMSLAVPLSNIPGVIDLARKDSATDSAQFSRSVAQELDRSQVPGTDSHSPPVEDLDNAKLLLQSVRFHFWTASVDSAHQRSYKFCRDPHQLFMQARVARLWKPGTRYRVLELRLRDEDYAITMCDPELDDPNENMKTFDAFIMEMRAQLAREVRDLIIDVTPVD